MPGQAKTFSTSTLAPSRKENTMLSVVITGNMALRKAYVTITVAGDRPLARAVRTKSDASTASIEARVMRAIGASEKIASVIDGRINWLNAERKVSKSRAIRASIR